MATSGCKSQQTKRNEFDSLEQQRVHRQKEREKERKREIQSVSDESEEEVHNPLKMATAEWMTVKLIRRHREWVPP